MSLALLIDESSDFLLRNAAVFRDRDFEVITADNLAEGRDMLLRELPELVVLGPSIVARERLPKLEKLLAQPELAELVEVHAVVDEGDEDARVMGERLGAIAIHPAPPAPERIAVEVDAWLDTLERHKRKGEVHQSGRGLLIGESPVMLRLYRLLRKIATTDCSVLVHGESGTGKELVSRTIHQLSRRAEQPFVAMNSGAMPENLAESELFGYRKGAFSGAEESREGIIAAAHGGTLFLDEITEMPEPLQVKLLRVLETGEYQRLGDNEARRSDFRLLAACNRDPMDAVASNDLRKDLYFRMAQFPLQLPPLRERGSDLELLAEHFLAMEVEASGQSKRFSPEALDLLKLHHWPGNVRELRNLVTQAFLLAGEVIRPKDIPESMGMVSGQASGSVEELVGQPLEDVERQMIEQTLEKTGGNKRQAARLLGISPKTLYARLKAYAADSSD